MKGQKGKLGPAFHNYLEYLENAEAALTDETSIRKQSQVPMIAINQAMFTCSEQDMKKIVDDLLPVDAYLAGVVRSSVKYKVNVETLVKLSEKYSHELATIGNTIPMRLPHEWCTIIIEGFGDDDMIVVAQEQTLDGKDSYPELGIEDNETPFICLNSVTYRPHGCLDMDDQRRQQQRLSHIPVEIHCEQDKLQRDAKCLYAGATGIDMTQEGQRIMDLIWKSFTIWHHQFQLQSILRQKSPGLAPRRDILRRHKRRKKIEHPMFEHTVIRMEIDSPEPGQNGVSFLQSKKRMHAVRGFWRTYRKTGLRVWVKPHWRGDEKLGVVRRDIELVTHEEEPA
jgi:hypothetical protein